MKAPKPSWIDGLAASLVGAPDTIPPDWYSCRTFAAAKGISHPHANKILYDAFMAGKCQRKKFKIAQPSGRLYPALFYGPPQKP